MSTTVEQLDALPEGAVVRSGSAGHWTWVRSGDKWTCYELQSSKYSGALLGGEVNLQILWPQPEPDHSMCARLAWDGDSWTLKHPNGGHGLSFSADQARDRGYPIPDTRTVEERVVDVLKELDKDDTPYTTVAAHLADLGLLAKNEEGDA